jgi:iron complex outermembrane receptor protein
MKRSIAALPALLLACALPASAQQTPRPDSVAPVMLPGVTVTVLRTPLALTRAPFAVSVHEGAELRRGRPGLALDQALRAIPGVQVDNRYNFALGERISIRGFGARSQFGVRGIRVMVDGIPATFPDGQTSLSHLDLGLLQRAEVIRGPAAALYGNTAGGVIQLESRDAASRPLAQEAEMVTGSDGLLRLRSTTSGRSGATSYLLGLSRLEYSGYREFSDARNSHLTARFGWAGSRDTLSLVATGVDYDADNPGSLSQALLDADRSQAYANNKLQRTGEEGRQGQVGLTWRRSSGPIGWEVTGYGIGRKVENPIPNSIIALRRQVAGGRAVARTSFDPRLTFSAGAELAFQRDDRQNYGNDQGARGGLTLDQNERVDDFALFAQAAADPTDRLTLLAALRYDRFAFGVDDHLVSAGNPDDSGNRTMDAVSPSAGASFAVSEVLHLYGNVATAFETPTTTELANRPSGAGGFNPELKPERTLSFEAGAKGSGPVAAYQVAVYRARVDDALVPFEVPEAAGRQFFRNAGQAVHRGAEAGVTLLPLPQVKLEGAYTYTDARFRGGELHDKLVPGISPHRAELTALYDASRGWFAAVETRYASRITVDDANAFRSPAYFLADLRAGLTDVRLGRITAEPTAGIENLFDARYNTSVVINAFGGRYFEPGPGRAFHLGLAVRI